MAWNFATDPFYRALLADIADTEWQCTEADFLAALKAGEVPPAQIPATGDRDKH